MKNEKGDGTEFRQQLRDKEFHKKLIDKRLDELGAEGWEVVSVVNNNQGFGVQQMTHATLQGKGGDGQGQSE